MAWAYHTVRGIADSAFYHKAERGMVEKDALESVGIDMLLRYRDDILILASSYEKFIAWFQKLKTKAGFFKLQCQEILRFSKVEDKEVQFLQFRVQMNAKSRRLRLIPHSKNISMPLERTSAHAPAVHEWPTKHVETMCNLATDQSAREEAKLSVMAKFRQHLTPEDVLAEMMDAGTHCIPRRVRSCTAKVLWLTLSWHPIWQFARFGRTVKHFCEHKVRYLLDQAFHQAFDVRVCWRNRLMYSSTLVSKL